VTGAPSGLTPLAFVVAEQRRLDTLAEEAALTPPRTDRRYGCGCGAGGEGDGTANI
jgi:hypothetical protein